MKTKQTSMSSKTGKRVKGGNRSYPIGVDDISVPKPTTDPFDEVTFVTASSASNDLKNSMTVRTYAGSGTKILVDIRRKPKAKNLVKPRKPRPTKVYGKTKTKSTKSSVDEADEKFWEHCKLLEDEDRCAEEEKERSWMEQDDVKLWDESGMIEAWNAAYRAEDDEAERCGWLEMKDDIKHEETNDAGGHAVE